MKRLVLLSLLLFPIFLFAQYPTFSNKQKLGVQTTGDGLIFRGTTVGNIPNYTPSNVNNAYFHLDTTNSKLYLYNDGWQQVYPAPQFDTTTLNVYLKISDTTAMLLPYFRDSDTTQLNLINRFALKLNISDTSVMLSPYLRKADTISLSNRINLKLNISDTTILSNRITTNANNIITINTKLNTKLDTIYVKFKNVVTRVLNKDTINIGSSLIDGYAINIIGDSINIDTTILDIRYPDRDSTNELQDITFATTSGVVTISGGKVMNLDTLYDSVIDSVKNLIQDSIAAFIPVTEGYGINIIGDSINIDTTIIFTQSDTITLSNRINNKLNATDTVSLSNRINLKLNKTDTINLSNRIDLKLNPTDTISLSNRINIKLNPSDTVSLSNRINTKLNTSDTISLSNRINKKLDTLYVNYQTSIDTIVNKDTINITTLEAGAGINIVNNIISLDTTLLDSVVRIQNVYVKNGTGTVLNKGEAVYVTGANGTNIIVGRASNVAESTSSKTLGLTMTSIGVNGFGYVIKEGLLKGLNTNSATAGDPIWLGVNGALIFGLANKPFAPKHLVYLGVVTDKNPSVGEVYVTVQNGFEIKELHDVQIIDPVNKASLYYNSSESLWRDTTATLLVSDTAAMLTNYLRTNEVAPLNVPLNTESTMNATLNINGNLNMGSGGTVSTPILSAGTIIKQGGTTSQFLKANGDIDSTNYISSSSAASTYLPLTGGTLTGDLVVNDTFKAKDFGNHTFVNYIQNGDFDLTSTIDASSFGYGYPNYIPLHWKSAATGKYVSTWSSTGGYSSPQHFKQYDGDASTGGALYQDVTNWQDLKGKTVTACGWFTKGTLTNSGNHAEIQINDGLTTTTTSIGTTTSWQRACVTKTISASATRVRVIVGCNLAVSGEGGAVSDIDAISLVIGEGKHEFSPKPLFDRDTQRLSGTLLIGYDSENNLAYNPSATSNLKVAGSTSLNGTLGVTGATTLTGGINGNIKTNGVDGATATPEYIWLGNTFSNGTTRDKLKIYLYNSGIEQYGFSVGGAGDIQYHSNTLHDFYIANSKKFSISNTNTTVNNSLTVNNSTVLNEGSDDFDTRIESDGNANMVFVDASENRVGIGTGTPSSTLSVNGSVNATDLSLTNPLPITSGGTGAESASVARTTLGVGYLFIEVTAGTVAILTSNRVSLVNTGGSLTTQLDLTTATNGRMYMIKNLASGTIVSTASNVIPFAGGSAGTAILGAGNVTPQWCTLIADGTNWHIMQRN